MTQIGIPDIDPKLEQELLVSMAEVETLLRGAIEGKYPLVIETMGHEMVHLALERKGEETHANHGAKFLILAEKVCTEFGWKLEDF
jgi:hypothetical protein